MKPKKIKLFIIEDNEPDIFILKENLLLDSTTEYIIDSAHVVSSALKLIDDTYDAILLDLGLPDSVGLNSLHKVLEQFEKIPVIITTVSGDKKTSIQAIQEGAQDYLIKGNFNTEILSKSVHYAIERKELQNQIALNERILNNIIQSVSDAILIVDTDGVVEFVNQSALKLFGRKTEDLVGEKFGFTIEKKTELDIVNNGKMYVGEMRTTKIEWKGRDRDASLLSIRDITERKQLEQKLKEMSFHDSLTGLYNRNFFEEEMKRLSNGRFNPVGIVMCDVDGLKFTNDTLGHEAGDQMLIQTANILRQNFRSSDIIARIGGDEFAILLTEIDSASLEQKLQKIHQAVEEYNATGPEIPLSLAVGHTLSEGQTTDMRALFREADDRMYRDKIQHKESARSTILQALTASMHARDFETQGHCERLQELAVSLGQSLGLSHDVLGNLSLLGLFHDLGKIGIPDHILFKSGPLTEVEWRQMRRHCEIGHSMASSVPELEGIEDYILKHHERWDGQGYPLGLSGEDIPIPCRVLAIIDAYDAMTSDRPYREAMSQEEAIAELRRCAGTQFAPELVEQFIQILDQNDTG